IVHLDTLLPQWAGLPGPTESVLYRQVNFNAHWCGLFWPARDAISSALNWFFTLFLLSLFLRREWICCIVVFVLAVIYFGFLDADIAYPMLRACTQGIITGLYLFAAMRSGMLTMAVGLFVAFVLQAAPLTTQRSVWYAPYGMIAV